MKVTVESTKTFRPFEGRYYRIWRGRDQKGQPIVLLVLGVNLKAGSDMSEAERDLRSIPMTGFEQTIVCTKEDIGPIHRSRPRKAKKKARNT